MKNLTKIFWSVLLLSILNFACKKQFLDEKPSSTILTPGTLAELQSLLESTSRINITGALGQICADEYQIISDQNYNSLASVIQRNGYIWSADLYQGEKVDDWNQPFQSIFYANSVLDVLKSKTFTDQKEANRLEGWARFIRAYAYYDLAKGFCKAYNAQTATKDKGLPIRLEAGIDVIQQRASLAATFGQILSDLSIASRFLDPLVPPLNKNRPSKAAVMALESRIYLYMGNFEKAEIYADSTLIFHDKLVDFNTVSTTLDIPFNSNMEEVIYQSNQLINFTSTTATGPRPDIEVNPDLYASFSADDLRKSIFFRTNTLGKINLKRGYIGVGVYPFTGLSVSEVYLNKAECLARRNLTTDAMDRLNGLLIKRFKNTVTFKPLTAKSSAEALSLVLNERRKELIWRGIRWPDLKRLNLLGANITLTRKINNIAYILQPNGPAYVFPIPEQEIQLSGIEQN